MPRTTPIRPVRRSRPAAATAVGAALLLAACGGVGQGQSGPAVTAGPVTGPLSTTGFGQGDEIAKARVDAFTQAYPDVRLTLAEGDFDEQQFLSAIAGGSPPDVVYMPRESLGTYAARKTLMPIDQCPEDVRPDLDALEPTAVGQVTFDDVAYGVPEFSQARVLVANTDLLEAGGTDLAGLASGDWDVYKRLNDAVNQKDGSKVRRIGFDPKLPEFFPLWAKANGVDILSADGRTAHLDDPKAAEALTFAAGLVKDSGGYAATKSFKDSFDFFGSKNEVAVGQVGAFPMENWYVTVLAENSPKAPMGVAAFADRSGKPLTWTTGSAWVIPAGAKNIVAACAFTKTMTASDTWMKAAQARLEAAAKDKVPFTGVFTGNADADAKILQELWKPSGNKPVDSAVQTVAEAQRSAFVLPASAAGAEFERAWKAGVQRVLEGKQDASEALAQAQDEAQKALDGAYSGTTS
jgi:multiple sugar transport system substrate-binding protein